MSRVQNRYDISIVRPEHTLAIVWDGVSDYRGVQTVRYTIARIKNNILFKTDDAGTAGTRLQTFQRWKDCEKSSAIAEMAAQFVSRYHA